MALQILGRPNSINVQKALWCCGELGLAFKREDVGGPFGGNRSEAYLALNPNGLIPTLVDGDFALWESNAIVRYLAARYGGEPLYPGDPRRRADAEKWMDWHLTTIMPVLTPVFWGLVRTPPAQRDAAAIERARQQLSAALAILDRALSRSAHVGGEAFTVGDIPLGIAAHRWFQMQMPREDYPALARWYQSLRARPAFREHVDIGLT